MTETNYDDKRKKKIKDLTLLLLYLNSWVENEYEQECRRSWKGYDFTDLNQLAEEGYISEGRKAKSVILYEEGIEKAKMLLAEYDI